MQSSDVQHISPNTIRIEIARRIVERKRQELGEHLIAAACYGSVAHNAALPHSDVEIVIVTDQYTRGVKHNGQ
jgi:predicted nucleotidyltransferase